MNLCQKREERVPPTTYPSLPCLPYTLHEIYAIWPRTHNSAGGEGGEESERQAVLVKIYAILLYSTGQLKEPTHRGVQAKGVGVQQGETLAT